MGEFRRRLAPDHVGGALMIVAGLAAAVAAAGYDIGSLRAMGSGFFPLVLGVLLALAGIAIVATTPLRARAPAVEATGAATTRDAPPAGIDARGALCILGAVLAFVALGEHGGLVPASFAAVFVAALGDRRNRVRDAAALAAAMTVFGVAVFHYGLHVLLPLFTWQ